MAGELAKIETVIGESTIWIDAEGQLRTPGGSALDLGKVREYLLGAGLVVE